MEECLNHKCVNLSHREAEEQIINDVAEGKSVKIFLDIEHRVPVLFTREISGSWLSIRVEKAVV